MEDNDIDITLEPSEDHPDERLTAFRPDKGEVKYVCIYHVGKKEWRQPIIDKFMKKFSREEYLRALSECGIWTLKNSVHLGKTSDWSGMKNDEIKDFLEGKLDIVEETKTLEKQLNEDLADFPNAQQSLVAMNNDGAPIIAFTHSGKIVSRIGLIMYPGSFKYTVL